MKTVKINKTFASHAECEAWEDENLDAIDKEHGGVILMVNHEFSILDGKVILKDIILL